MMSYASALTLLLACNFVVFVKASLTSSLHNWAIDRGVIFGDIYVRYTDSVRGHDIYANRDMDPGEVVLRIPASLVIMSSSGKDDGDPLWSLVQKLHHILEDPSYLAYIKTLPTDFETGLYFAASDTARHMAAMDEIGAEVKALREVWDRFRSKANSTWSDSSLRWLMTSVLTLSLIHI